MRKEDEAAFEAVIQDLCLAFNRPYTAELTRVFWQSLKWAHVVDIKRAAQKWADSAKKFPTPKDLRPEKATVAPAPRDTGPPISSWAIAANRILFVCCYQGERGFKAVGPEHLQRLLAAKADYVRMAEQAQASGEKWDTIEFNRMCREGFTAMLAERDAA